MGHEHDLYFEVRRKQREQSDKALKTFSAECLRRTEKPCTLAQVRDAFGNRTGVSMSYFMNDFTETLTMTAFGTDFELSIAQFPKEKKNHPICLKVGNHLFNHSMTSKCTPESIAEFMAALIGWFPDYLAIEERIREAEQQKRLACEIAFDMLKRTLKPILEKKGYKTFSITSYDHSARIKVEYDSCTCIVINVELLEDFLEGATKIVQSLPSAADK